MEIVYFLFLRAVTENGLPRNVYGFPPASVIGPSGTGLMSVSTNDRWPAKQDWSARIMNQPEAIEIGESGTSC